MRMLLITTVQLQVYIDILYIKMNIYSPVINTFTLFAPLEALKLSSDRIKLMQAQGIDISTSCTQICTLDFRYQLHNNGISKLNFKEMSNVADALNFTKIILLHPYDDFCMSYYKILTPSKSVDVIK
jgi:hypothetical protein